MTHRISRVQELLARRHRKIGLPPGTLLPPEQPPAIPVTIHLMDYDADSLEERPLPISAIETLHSYLDRPTVTWIDVTGVHDVQLIQELGELLSIHPLTREDITSIGQRPKLEDGGSYLYIVCPMLTFNATTCTVEAEQVSLILGQGFVLTFQERPGDVFDPVRERLRQRMGRIRQHDASYLAYALLDVIVDHYFLVLEAISERAEQLEANVLDQTDQQKQHELAALRRELI